VSSDGGDGAGNLPASAPRRGMTARPAG
jgi:hypothetical protein